MRPGGCVLLALALVLVCTWRPAGADLKIISDKDVDRIEEEWAKQDEIDEDHPINVMKRREARAQAPPIVPGQPLDMAALDAAQNVGKPRMIFAAVTPMDQRETEKVFARYQDILLNGQISIKNYVIEPHKVLVVVDDYADGRRVMDFLLEQPEVLSLEVDQKQFFPKGRAAGGQAAGVGGKSKKKKADAGKEEKKSEEKQRDTNKESAETPKNDAKKQDKKKEEQQVSKKAKEEKIKGDNAKKKSEKKKSKAKGEESRTEL